VKYVKAMMRKAQSVLHAKELENVQMMWIFVRVVMVRKLQMVNKTRMEIAVCVEGVVGLIVLLINKEE